LMKKLHLNFVPAELLPPPGKWRVLLGQLSLVPSGWVGVYVVLPFPMVFEVMKAL